MTANVTCTVEQRVNLFTKPTVMEYFIHNMNTIETKTSEEQETKISSTET